MDTKILNTRKKELLDAQSTMLDTANAAKRQLTGDEEIAYTNIANELTGVETNIARYASIEKGRAEVGAPRETPVITSSTASKFFAFAGGSKATTPLPTCTSEYSKGFWASLKSRATFERFQIENAALGEGGTSAAGGALVPVETDPTIPFLAMEECSARGLSRNITTTMNLNLPFQSALTVAALKPESNSSGVNAFASNSPSFGTTLLSAFTIGDSVPASWELLADAKAAGDFITFDLARSIVAKEENLFINGSGTNQPQGYLGNGLTASGPSITAGAATLGINPIIDTVGSLNKAYYRNANWLVNRQEWNRLLKLQIASNQFQTFLTSEPDGTARLFGWKVNFSGEMPTFAASPATSGAWLFGDFASYAVIGSRDDNNIRIKVLDQIQALDGQTVILGYRRADQRILIGQAVVQFNTTG
jgi:HK97 family phage major capsid protein